MIPVSEHVSHPRPRHKVDNSSWFQIFEPFPAIPEDSVGVAHMLGPALSKLHHIPVAMKNIFLCTWHFKRIIHCNIRHRFTLDRAFYGKLSWLGRWKDSLRRVRDNPDMTSALRGGGGT